MRNPMICWLAVVFALNLPLHAGAHSPEADVPPWQRATEWPDRIIVTLAGNPAHSFSVTWRTCQGIGETIAEIAPASADARFDLASTAVRATTENVVLDSYPGPNGPEKAIHNLGLEPVNYHSVTFRGLEPDTLYAYRVRGARGNWSPWRQVRTAPLDGPVTFVFFGDAQTGIRSHVTRTIDAAALAVPEARFLIHGGDLVNKATYDKEWAEWFEAGGRTYATIPSLPVPGNHDYLNFGGEKLFRSPRAVTPLWRPQFTLPVEKSLPPDLHETVYGLQYTKDLHIFAIDSSGIAFDQQMKWLDGALKASSARWRVVTMHHPLYSFVGGEEDESAEDLRAMLKEVIENNDVDLVLTGHRHSYQRSECGDNVAQAALDTPHAVDTVYVVTATSTKRGYTKVDGWERFSEQEGGHYTLSRYADYIPLYAAIAVDGGQLSFRALDPLGAVYDEFVLTEGDGGAKTITNGEAAFGPVKNQENAGPYREWDDLR